ncbi:MAG: hypothetical protein EF807_06745 [Candidatus Methanolliviera hydrocarbonicum]|uniref:UPF0146 protein EF807_06745 n=1 Tax=Candidatus Methanolliviera hydrocarbonicum TaxID=2491085 RepID=A0A520KWL2_9EURY|nr:MAG: hypothetical protein EF807_06745 [Candidatus Methanolliviera hydrocarbonicum]
MINSSINSNHHPKFFNPSLKDYPSRMFSYLDMTEYIIKNYSGMVVEIGVGYNFYVGKALYEKMRYFATDIKEIKNPPFNMVMDDVFDPDLPLYEGAKLLLSINPPEEIQPAICELGRMVSSSVILKSLNDETIDFKRYYKEVSIINYKKARFYELKSPR